MQENVWQVNEGALAEQFVGQELLASGNAYEKNTLYFWERGARGSTAEVDYVTQIGSRIIPIDVKAGKDGRLRSLKQIMSEKEMKSGVLVSQSPMEVMGSILNLPFYLIDQLPRIMGEEKYPP